MLAQRVFVLRGQYHQWRVCVAWDARGGGGEGLLQRGAQPTLHPAPFLHCCACSTTPTVTFRGMVS